jgi:hypothetical protein
MLYGRPFEWFNRNYLLSYPTPTGIPIEWAQYGSGSNGTIYVGPVPAVGSSYTINLDCAALPASLVNPQDLEILPYPWTDAVPYFASYLAFLNSQRTSDAEKMFSIYQVFTKRAREISVPTATPQNFKSPKLAQGMGGQNGAA